MEYLTYAEYKELGGTALETAFALLLDKAIRKLNYFTMGKMKECAEVKVVLKEFVETLNNTDDMDGITSFSNGNVSVSFGEDKQSLNEELYAIAEEILPLEMISRC